MTIKPVSDLRNYNEVLQTISVGDPVFLTKNGRGKYVIIDIEEYEKTQAALRLLNKLSEGEESAKKDGWISFETVADKLGIQND